MLPNISQSKANQTMELVQLTLFRIGFFGAAYGWGDPKKPPFP